MNYRRHLKRLTTLLAFIVILPIYLLCGTSNGLKFGVWLLTKQVPWQITSPSGTLVHGAHFDSIVIGSENESIHIKHLSFKLKLHKIWMGRASITNLYTPAITINQKNQSYTLHHTGGQLTITPTHIKAHTLQTAYQDYYLTISGKIYPASIQISMRLNQNNQPLASAILTGPYQTPTIDSYWFNQIHLRSLLTIEPAAFKAKGTWETIATSSSHWPKSGQIQMAGNAEQTTLTLNSNPSPSSTIQSLNLIMYYKNALLSIERLQAHMSHQHILFKGQLDLAKQPLQMNGTLAIIGNHPNYPYHLQIQGRGIWYPDIFDGIGDINGHIGYQTIEGRTKFNHQQGFNIEQLVISSQSDQIKLSGALDRQHIQINSTGQIHNFGSYFQGIYGGSQWDMQLSGPLNNPAVHFLFQCTDINNQYGSIQSCKGQFNAPAGLAGNAQANLTIKQLKLPLLALEHAEMAWQGHLHNHTLVLKASTPILQLTAKVDGQWRSTAYQGLVQQLTMQSLNRTWQLKQPKLISLSTEELKIPELCLTTADQPDTCWYWHAHNNQQEFSMQWHLPLNILLATNPWQLSSDCMLHGQATWAIQNHQWQAYQANLHSKDCHIGFAGTTEQIQLQALTFESQLKEEQLYSQLHLQSDLNNQITFKNIWPTKQSPAPQTLQGELELDCQNLAPLADLSNHISKIQGSLTGHLTLRGLMTAPQFHGQINLKNFGLRWPELGLQWTRTDLQINANEQTWHYRGTLHDRTGKLTLEGHSQWQHPEAPVTELNIQGTHISLLHTANYQIQANPNLLIEHKSNALHIKGQVTIENSRLIFNDYSNIEEMPSDVIIIDKPTTIPWLKNYAQLTIDVILGQQLHLQAYGLNGQLQGNLAIRKILNEPMTIDGMVHINQGIYHFLDQQLRIKTGNLKFLSTTYSNPALYIIAQKKIDVAITDLDDSTLGQAEAVQSLTIGTQITGTLLQPKIQFFSKPIPLDKQEILSYLVLGFSTKQATKSQARQLLRIFNILSSQPGQTDLTHSIQKYLGLDELGFKIEQSTARFKTEQDLINPNAAVTETPKLVIGKRLSPRIQLKYHYDINQAMHLLITQFKMSRYWKIQTEHSVTHNSIGLIYAFEFGQIDE